MEEKVSVRRKKLRIKCDPYGNKLFSEMHLHPEEIRETTCDLDDLGAHKTLKGMKGGGNPLKYKKYFGNKWSNK